MLYPLLFLTTGGIAARAASSNSLAAVAAAAPPCKAVDVNTTAPVFETRPYFASFNIDASRQRIFFDVNFSDPRLLYLVSQIRPARIRFGGTGNNFLFYDVGSAAGSCPPSTPFVLECLNSTLLDAVLAVSAAASSPLWFGLNMQPIGGGPPAAPFNASNARALLEYLYAKDPRAVAAFELGNELNGKVTASEAAAAFLALDAVIADVWRGDAARPALVGPDSNGSPEGRATYLAAFAAASQGRVSALTYHEYIGASADNVLNATFLDRTAENAAATARIIRAVNATVDIVAGEIGPHIGQGANSSFAHCNNNRLCGRFGSTLWYADAMAASARGAVAAFCRQDLLGADYAILNTSAPGSNGSTMTGGFTPSSDYYFLVLWGRVVGARVLDAGVSNAGDSVRVYAFCAAGTSSAATLVVVNLAAQPRCIKVPSFAAGNVTAYALTAGDGAGVESYGVRLNGALLQLGPSGLLPPLAGAALPAHGSVALPAQSVSLLVVPAAAPLPACS